MVTKRTRDAVGSSPGDSEDEAEVPKKKRGTHTVFKEFADATSMHGVPHIINARSAPARIFWSLICLGAFAMFFWQSEVLLERYYSYPKKVNVEILQKPVPFPAVSVCNVNHLDFEIAEKLSERLKRELDGAAPDATEGFPEYDYDMMMANNANFDNVEMPVHKRATRNTAGSSPPNFVDDYVKFAFDALTFVQAYSYFFSSSDQTVGIDFTIEALSRLGLPANLGTKSTSSGGTHLKDFIINCRFMDDKCNVTESFMRIFDPYYFNCFTFDPVNMLPSRSMRLRGVDYGLSLLLFTGSGEGRLKSAESWGKVFLPGVEESDSALASGRGARVVVHSPNTRPFPTAEAYDIPPGFSVTIGVKAQENVRINGNHGNCTRDAVDPSMETTFNYTLISCQNNCIQKKIISECKCVDNRLSFPSDTESEGMPFCFKLPEDLEATCRMSVTDAGEMTFSDECYKQLKAWRDRMECRRKVYDDMTKNKPEAMEMCKCYPPCNDIVYDSTYSLSTLPDNPDENKAFLMDLQYYTDTLNGTRKDILIKKFGDKLEKGMMPHLARLNVHIADNNIMKTVESPDYEAIRLMSDIGGQLGLWIGISVMTLFEVLQLIADVFHYLTSKRNNNMEENQEDISKMIKSPDWINGHKDRLNIPVSNNDNYDDLPCEVDRLTTV